jgi:sporulation protein YlmC with PRC-barrel domain
LCGLFRLGRPIGNLTGNDVVNVEGERLGTIATYGIDLERGRIAYAVLSVGDFRGFRDKWFAIPWDALQCSLMIGSSSSM